MASVFQTFDRKTGRPHPRWRFTFRDWTGRRKTATGTPDRKETERLAADVEARHDLIRKGHLPPPDTKAKHGTRSFEATAREYLDWGCSQGGLRGGPWGQGHAAVRKAHLRWWRERLGLETLADLDGVLPRVEAALREHGAEVRPEGQKGAGTKRCGKTLALTLESLSAFCRWAVERHYLPVNPLEYAGRIDTTPQREKRRALTREEIGRLLAVAPENRRLLYRVALATGYRVGELRALTLDSLDMKRPALLLDGAFTKNRKPAAQEIARELADMLADFGAAGTAARQYEQVGAGGVPDAPLLYVPRHAARLLSKDLQAAGVPLWTSEGLVDFHGLRVTAITLVAETGADLATLQAFARHNDPKLTMSVYAKARREKTGAVASALGNVIFSAPHSGAESLRKAAGAEGMSDITGAERGRTVLQAIIGEEVTPGCPRGRNP